MERCPSGHRLLVLTEQHQQFAEQLFAPFVGHTDGDRH